MTEITNDDLTTLLSRFQGMDGWAVDPDFFDDKAQGLDITVMQDLYARVPRPPVAYKKDGVFDCDKFARWVAIHVDALWAVNDPPLPLAQGWMTGMLPLDGDDRIVGPHALNWFIDREKKLWLRGAQDLQVMNQSALDRIQGISRFEVG